MRVDVPGDGADDYSTLWHQQGSLEVHKDVFVNWDSNTLPQMISGTGKGAIELHKGVPVSQMLSSDLQLVSSDGKPPIDAT